MTARGPDPGGLGGQPFPSLAAPPLEDQPATLCAHTLTKTVDACTPYQSGLKCPFHDGAPAIRRLNRVLRSYNARCDPGKTSVAATPKRRMYPRVTSKSRALCRGLIHGHRELNRLLGFALGILVGNCIFALKQSVYFWYRHRRSVECLLQLLRLFPNDKQVNTLGARCGQLSSYRLPVSCNLLLCGLLHFYPQLWIRRALVSFPLGRGGISQ